MKSIRTIIAVSLIPAIAVLGIYMYSKKDIKPATTVGAVVNISTNEAHENNKASGNKIDALYSDGAVSINEMKKNSDLIVVGKVISKEQVSEFSVRSTVSVEKAYKGKSTDEIYVLEMAGDSLLNVGEEFILFLGVQGDNKENKYFIKGGIQGAFKKDSNNKLKITDNIMRADFDKLKKDKNNDELSIILRYIEE